MIFFLSACRVSIAVDMQTKGEIIILRSEVCESFVRFKVVFPTLDLHFSHCNSVFKLALLWKWKIILVCHGPFCSLWQEPYLIESKSRWLKPSLP